MAEISDVEVGDHAGMTGDGEYEAFEYVGDGPRPTALVTRPILPGCIVLLRGDAWAPADGQDVTDWTADTLAMFRNAAGHDRFVLLVVPDLAADVDVYGPDDVIERMADAILERARQMRRAET